MALIAPSLLSADFLNLEKDVRMLNEHADILHLDIMDGSLVPNISFGFSVVEPLSKIACKPMDAHLMIVNPDKYADKFADLGVDMLSFHLEASEQQGSDPKELLERIQARGVKAGLAFNPDMPLKKVFPYLEFCDFVLCMTVFAGFGGQKIDPYGVQRIQAIKEEIISHGLNTLLEVDGGVNAENIASIKNAGADIIVAGSSVFRSDDPARTIDSFRQV